MKIKVNISQLQMNKSRKFVFFTNENKRSDFITIKQAETVINTFKQLNIPIDNQTGLNF